MGLFCFVLKNLGLQVLNSELKDLTSHFKEELQQLSDKLLALAPWPKVLAGSQLPGMLEWFWWCK